ncbi:hypothetical protein GCM10022232_41990 [Streptomyces plumbiresistens]|uniref:Cas12f1-like TNB domain-containing protein n=1 Tax=Streptomyces plumbiresistens TaxID=511811 RepID=A0ABP7RMH9_9ACTN
MAQVAAAVEVEHARYAYLLRVSSTARTALAADWDRCRWVWNECVAKSRAVHLHNKATGQKATCPAPGAVEGRQRLVLLRVRGHPGPARHGQPRFDVLVRFGAGAAEVTRTTMARKAADAAIGATKKALIEMGRKHGRDIRLVNPAHTTMDCAHCDARAKHRLPLGERTYTCTACGSASPRDKNSARVMLVRAGLNPAGAEGARSPGALLQEAA